MSGIYIPGMEMPKRGHTVTLTILGGGEVCVQYYDCKPHLAVPIVYKAIPVPDHGRLIEERDVLAIASEYCPDDDGSVGKVADLREMLDEIEGLPTIIPADPVDKEEP